MAISLRLNTRRQTTIATSSRLPRRYAPRNDNVGTHETWPVMARGVIVVIMLLLTGGNGNDAAEYNRD